MDERRKYIRVDDTLKIIYSIAKPFKGKGSATTRNVSQGGICFPTDQRLQVNMHLDLNIYLLNDAKPITALGKIVWCKKISSDKMPYLVGVEFTTISSADFNRLTMHIRKLALEQKRTDIRLL